MRRGLRDSLGSIAVALTISLLGLAANAASAPDQPPMMAIPGRMSASATGAFSYTIPINVPPGTAGMVPVLTLDYSSQAGDGLQGYGWVLSGLPFITRCPKTVAQDGVHGGINYDGNDRFCMEGQRLVAISGTYGDNDTEYRTEIDSFSKIISYGTSPGGGPLYFKVWTKSGQVIEFGNTADSRIEAVGRSVVRLWTINRLQDRKGNYLTVSYVDDQTNGQFYPTRIDYTGKGSVSTYNSVRFEYADRNDITPTYQAGSLQKITKLLTRIRTYAGPTTVVADYNLAYQAGSSTAHSRLTSVTLCDGTTPTPACLPPTTFGWQGSRDTLTVTSIQPSVALHSQCPLFGDFNGDGLTDFFFLTMYSPNTAGTAYLGTQTFGTFSTGATINLSGQVYADYTCTQYQYGSGDTNGDGITDLTIKTQASGAWTLYSLIGTNQSQFSQLNAIAAIGTWTKFSDYNGDGRIDFLTGSGSVPGGVELGNGDGTFTLLPFSYGAPYDLPIADFVGDGCRDLNYTLNSAGAFIDICQPARAPIPSPTQVYQFPGDFNGDGISDIFGLVGPCGPSHGNIYLSTSTTFTSAFCAGPDLPVVMGDWNGDGKTDIAFISQTPGTPHQIFLSTGSGVGAPLNIPNTVQGSEGDPNTGIVADFNNDGASDLWIVTHTGETLYTFGYSPELMTSVSNSVGWRTTVTYDRLNKNGNLYTKGTGGAYPTQNIDGPLYAVSRVDTSNGLGLCTPPSMTNCYSQTYAYSGAKTDLSGRGFLGFSQITITDLQTNIVRTTTYDTSFPYIGMIDGQAITHSGVTLSQTTNTFSNTPTTVNGSTRYFVFLTQSVVVSNDLDGASMPTVTTTYSNYDSYGNIGAVTVALSDGASKTTTNTFSNDATSWILGRLLTSQVQSIVGASNITRHSSFAYQDPVDPNSGLLTQEVLEPNLNTCNSGASSCTVTTGYGYDAFGNRTSVTVSGADIASRTTSTAYDAQGEFVISTTNALDQSDAWSFNPSFGLATSHTAAHHTGEDPANFTTSWSYDTFGRRTLETRPDLNKTAATYEYCAGVVVGATASCPAYGVFVVTVTLQNAAGAQNGPKSRVFYDALARAIANDVEGFDGSWIRTAKIYDANGRLHQASRPYFADTSTPKWITSSYDDLGRITQQVFPDTSDTTFCYHGLTTSATNDNGQTRATTNNPQGLPAVIKDGTGAQTGCVPLSVTTTTTFAYDAFGDLTTVTDPLGNVTTNVFDVRGRRVSSADPDLGTSTIQYDVLSELVSQTDARGTVTTLGYDKLGRTTSRTEDPLSGPTLLATWTWDTAANGVGWLASLTGTSSSYSRTNTYDEFGRPDSTTLSIDGSNYAYSVTYNSDGNLLKVNFPSGLTLRYLYTTTQNYLRRMRDNSTNVDYWTVNSRDAEMHALRQTAGNDVVTRQTYDDDTGYLTRVRAGTNNVVADFSFTFDGLGNLTSRTDSNQSYTERFCYDNLNRLTNWAFGTSCTSGSNHKTASYDLIGNITSKPDACTAGACTYGYPAPGGGSGSRPHAVSSISGTVNGLVNPTFTYDAAGNMTAGIGRTVTYTPFNMTDTVTQGTSSFAFTYDPEHQRIKQVDPTATTLYLKALGATSERVTSGSTTTWHDYVVADGKIIAERFKVVGGSPIMNYFVLDHLGSVVAITDDAASIVQQLSYDAWGKRRNANGTDAVCGTITSPTTRGYTGHEEIDPACLINMNARVYDPTIARFMSADTFVSNAANLQDWNSYSYVGNNPLSFTDPTGHFGVVEVVEVTADRLRQEEKKSAQHSVAPPLNNSDAGNISRGLEPMMPMTPPAFAYTVNFQDFSALALAKLNQSGLSAASGSPTSSTRNLKDGSKGSSVARNSSPCDQACRIALITGSVWSAVPLVNESGDALDNMGQRLAASSPFDGTLSSHRDSDVDLTGASSDEGDDGQRIMAAVTGGSHDRTTYTIVRRRYFLDDPVRGLHEVSEVEYLYAITLGGYKPGAPVTTHQTITIQSGHGGRHLPKGVSRNDVENAIVADIQLNINSYSKLQGWTGRVVVGTQTIEYRGFNLPTGGINVGTYYPIP